MRRQTHEAGVSWRKWTEPTIREQGWLDAALHSPIVVVVFLVDCLFLGIVLGLMVAR